MGWAGTIKKASASTTEPIFIQNINNNKKMFQIKVVGMKVLSNFCKINFKKIIVFPNNIKTLNNCLHQ